MNYLVLTVVSCSLQEDWLSIIPLASTVQPTGESLFVALHLLVWLWTLLDGPWLVRQRRQLQNFSVRDLS